LDAIPASDIGHFNLANLGEIRAARLGTPFRQFTIDPGQILNYDPSKPLDELVTPMGIWYFPVVVDGRARTLLYVEVVNGVWRASGIGSSGIAVLWDAAQAARPSERGHANLFVRIFQTQGDFVLSTREGVAEMIPLKSSPMTSPELERRGLRRTYDPASVILSLQDAVKRGMPQPETSPKDQP